MDTLESLYLSKDTYNSRECLPSSFYDRKTQTVARALLGKLLVRRLSTGELAAAPIVEVEAYTQEDRACHAYKGPTRRCQVMFGPPGLAYVYFIYGMYHCLNVVTEGPGRGCAVLLRGLDGGAPKGILSGPGKLCRTLAIDLSHNGLSLYQKTSPIHILDAPAVDPARILETPRIGISKDKHLNWRYLLQEADSLEK